MHACTYTQSYPHIMHTIIPAHHTQSYPHIMHTIIPAHHTQSYPHIIHTHHTHTSCTQSYPHIMHTIIPAHHAHTADNYVHRLVQNKSDGKLVAVEGPGNVQGVSSARWEPVVCSRYLCLTPLVNLFTSCPCSPLLLPQGGVRREAGLTSVGVHVPPHEPTGVPKGLLWGEADKGGDSGQWAGKHCSYTPYQAVRIAWWHCGNAIKQLLYVYIAVYQHIYNIYIYIYISILL